MKKMKKINKQLRSNLITYGIVVAAYIIVTLCMQAGMISSLLQGLLVPLCVYVILAISLNLTVGILGELSLGHAGFMCAGAFSGALFSKITADMIHPAGLRFFLALLVGTAVAALFGFLIGIPVLRLKGDYLAIVTLAFGEIIKNVVNVVFLGRDSAGFHVSTKDSMSLGLEPGGQVLIKGPQGITGTPNDSTFLIGIILILVTLFIVINLINSRTGRAIMAIRDNRIAAESVGIDITKYRNRRRALRPQPVYADCAAEELRLQHVHHDSGIRGTGRHRQYPRLYHRGCGTDTASGAPPFPERLPYADLRSRPDRDYDLHLQPGRPGDSGAH